MRIGNRRPVIQAILVGAVLAILVGVVIRRKERPATMEKAAGTVDVTGRREPRAEPQMPDAVEREPAVSESAVGSGQETVMDRHVPPADIVAEASVPPSPDMAERVSKLAEWIKNAGYGPRRLADRFKTMGGRGDELGIRVLMRLGSDGWMEQAVVEGLAYATNTPLKNEVVAFLRERVRNDNIMIACAAAEGIARVGGDRLLQEMTEFVALNWRRPDGHGEKICGAVVKGVADVGTYAAGEWLVRQLARADERDWLYDYGSVVVESLKKYPHPLVRRALLEYVERVRARAAREIGTPREYLLQKAREAEDTAMAMPE